MTNKPMGVAVYPHVTTGPAADTARVLDAIDESARVVLSLSDDEIDYFAWQIADANKKCADNLAESLMDSVDVLNAGGQAPDDDTAVTTALRALMALDAAQLADLAQKLAGVDATFSDRLADMLLGNLGVDAPPVMPSERFLRAVLQRVADDEYRHQVAMAQ